MVTIPCICFPLCTVMEFASMNFSLLTLCSLFLGLFVSVQVFDDVATELAMAIMQFFSAEHSEEHIFRCMKGLVRFAYIAHSEVPMLIKMIGPDPTQFRGEFLTMKFQANLNLKFTRAYRNV